MKIDCLNSKYIVMNVRSYRTNYSGMNTQKVHFCPQNLSFGGTLYDDDILDNSIFALKDKQQRLQYNGNFKAFADYWASQKNIGFPIKDANMAGWEIKRFMALGNNTYKGGMREAINYIDKFKEIGLKKFIILCPELKNAVISRLINANMDYDSFFVPIMPRLSADLKGDIMEDFSINQFINTMLDLRKGDTFIGCENGTLRTNRMLMVFKNLDPYSKIQLPKEKLSSATLGNYQFAQWIYEAMNDKQKALLGYTKEFETKLKENFYLMKTFNFR